MTLLSSQQKINPPTHLPTHLYVLQNGCQVREGQEVFGGHQVQDPMQPGKRRGKSGWVGGLGLRGEGRVYCQEGDERRTPPPSFCSRAVGRGSPHATREPYEVPFLIHPPTHPPTLQYLYTLSVSDSDKAEKLTQSLPPGLQRKDI